MSADEHGRGIATMTLEAGARLGPYRIVRLIGAGGMGAVHEAVHVVLEKRVALKTLHGHVPQDASAVTRFVEEGRAASRLRHPHVVDITDVGVEEGTPYLVMELLEGESLANRLTRVGALPPETAVDLLLPIVDALAVAHDAGIVHRDLKPDNVFLVAARTGTHPKLLDFGISRVTQVGAERLTQSATMLGTPCYMAPEQARDAKSVDARADIFSLGLVLYEMLAGVRAIGGESLIEVLQRVVTVDIQPLRQVRPDVPDALAGVVGRMLAARPEDRHASMRELGAVLLPFASAAARATWSGPFAGPSGSRERVDPVAATSIGVGGQTPRAGSAPARDATPRGASAARGAAVAELACPPLDVVGIDEPSGWLGATAAHAIARRARWLYGGGAEHVLGPAQLAGLSPEPSARAAISPFDDAKNRQAALTTAPSRAAAVLTGVVERRRGGILLQVQIESHGQALAHAESEASSLAAAAREIVSRLGEVLGWRALDAGAMEAYGAIDPKDGLVLEDALVEFCVPEARLALLEALPRLGAIGRGLAARIGEPVPEVDPSSPASRAWTASARTSAGLPLPAEIEKTLGADADAARTLEARAVFRALAAMRAVQTGDADRAWSLALRATSIDPTSTCAWEALARVTPRPRMNEAHAWRLMTWAPDTQAVLPPENDVERAWGATITRRAYILQPADPLPAFHLAAFLVRAGDITAAESFAAELDESPSMRRAAEAVRAVVDLQQARFARALARLKHALLDEPERPLGGGADTSWLIVALQAADVLGRAPAFCDELLVTKLLHAAPRIERNAFALDVILIETATLASPEVGTRALARLRALGAERFFETPNEAFEPLLRAAEGLVAGRTAEVIGAIRPLATSLAFRTLLARLYEAGGAHDLAARVDDSLMASDRSMCAGLQMAHVRAARRAARAGRMDTARALATRIVEAWSVADDEIPLLDEMRSLAANP